MKRVYSSGKWCLLKTEMFTDWMPDHLLQLMSFWKKKLKYDMSLGMKTM